MQDDLLIHMREILQILFRKKWSMVIIFFTTVFTAIFLVYFLISPGYGANATIIMNNASVLTQPLRDGPPESDLEKLVRFTTQQDIIMSLRIATEASDRIKLDERRVIGRLELLKRWVGNLKQRIGNIAGIQRWDIDWDPRAAAIGAVEDNITASSPADSNAIFLSYQAKDPVEAADTLNAVIDVFSEYYYGVIRENANGIVGYLQGEFDVAVDKLQQAEIALTEFKLNSGRDTNQDAKQGSGSSPITRQNLLGLNDSLRLQSEISEYMLQLEEELRQATDITDNERRDRVVKDIQSRIDSYIAFINDLPRRELEMVRLTRAFEIASDNYNLLQRNLASAKLVAGGQTEQINLVEIFDRPRVETDPISPKKRIIVIMSAFMGITMAFTWAFVLNYFDHTVRTARDVERYFNLRVLGSTAIIK